MKILKKKTKVNEDTRKIISNTIKSKNKTGIKRKHISPEITTNTEKRQKSNC